VRTISTDISQELLQLPGFLPDDVLEPLPEEYGRDSWPASLKAGLAPASIAVLVRPRSTTQVAQVLQWASSTRHSVEVAGAGSNVVGALAGRADVVLALDRMTNLLELDPVSQVVRVEAGILGDALEHKLEARGYTLGHYPQSLNISTAGGWVSTRATGTYSARYGGIERLICGATFVTGDGRIHTISPRVRPTGGVDALSLICGAEGSLAVVTEVAFTMHRRLPERFVCVRFESFAEGLDAQRHLVQSGYPIALLRLYNEPESQAVLPPGHDPLAGCLLIASTVGPEELVERDADAIRDALCAHGGSVLPTSIASHWRGHRYAGRDLMTMRNAAPGVMFDTIEVSLPWATAAACAAELDERLRPVSSPFYLHSSHVYTTGTCLYMMLFLSEPSDAEVLTTWRGAWDVALEIVERHRGQVGHHHGIGAVRRDAYQASPDGKLHARIKNALDPFGTFQARLVDGATAARGESAELVLEA
jgi:alkyldihydroxyacetonephosphate synthase